MQIDLPDDVARVIHAIVVENVMPRYRALAEFERALSQASKPPASEPPASSDGE